jgi:ATP-dependent RNA helicase SUPV3L1/SUV3
MAGLGYKGEKGERVKVKATEPPKTEEPQSTAPIPEEVSVLAPPPEPEAVAEGAEAAPQEMEVFYTFTWAPKPRFQRPERGNRGQQGERPNRGERPQGDRPQGERPQGDRPRREGADRPQGERREGGKPKGGKPERRDGGKPQGGKAFEARPPRAEKPIDPDNPFAVLAALKNKS